MKSKTLQFRHALASQVDGAGRRGTTSRRLLPQTSLHLGPPGSTWVEPHPAQHTSALWTQKYKGVMATPVPAAPGAHSGAYSGLGKDEQAQWTPSVTGQHGWNSRHCRGAACFVLEEGLFKGAVGALNISLSLRTGSAPGPERESITLMNVLTACMGQILPTLKSCLPDTH